MRNFSHSNIPTVHEVGEQDGIEYFILEYIVGVDLATLLGHPISARSLNSEMALYILAQLTDVLRYIHEFEMPNPAKGDFVPLEVLHRDICPAHVLLSVEGDVLLTGFGSASSWLLRTEHTRETLHRSYQALELQAGAKATPQSDLFSLAAVFWEMLTGHRFKPSQVQTPLGRKVPGVSSKLAEVLRFNLNEDPECRHESAYRVLQRIGQSPEAESAWRSRHELSALVCTAFDARRT
jgi:serine/threonine-protein kinase